MAYTTEEVMLRFRSDVDDKLPSDENDAYCLWSNDQVEDFLNQALMEFCERTGYLTKEIRTAIVAGQKTINIKEDIIKVRRAALLTANKELRMLNAFHDDHYVEKDYGFTARNAFDDTTGIPTAIMFDLLTGKADLHPIPSAADTLILNAVIVPRRIEIGIDQMPIEQERYVDQAILPLMKHFAYEVHDADSYDPTLSEKYRRLAEDGLLRIRSRVNKARRDPGVTRYGGIT